MSKKINKRKTKIDLRNMNYTDNDLNNPAILYYHIFHKLEITGRPISDVINIFPNSNTNSNSMEKEFYSDYFTFNLFGNSDPDINENLIKAYATNHFYNCWLSATDSDRKMILNGITDSVFYKLWKLTGSIILTPDPNFLSSLPNSIDFDSLNSALTKLPYDTFIVNEKNFDDITVGVPEEFIPKLNISSNKDREKGLFTKVHYSKKHKTLFIKQVFIPNAFSKPLSKPLLKSIMFNNFIMSLSTKEAFDKTFNDFEDDDILKYTLMKFLTIIAYIGCINGDIKQLPDKQIRIPTNLKTKIKPKEFIIGETVGAAIRKHNQDQKINVYLEGNGTTKSPHVRRGHFHHFWAGNKDNRHLILKWIDPIFVNCSNDEEKKKLPITNKEVIG